MANIYECSVTIEELGTYVSTERFISAQIRPVLRDLEIENGGYFPIEATDAPPSWQEYPAHSHSCAYCNSLGDGYICNQCGAPYEGKRRQAEVSLIRGR